MESPITVKMRGRGTSRLPAARQLLTVLFAAALCGCATNQLHVLQAPPPTAFRTLGMVSGAGANEASAIQQATEQAESIDADAIVIENRRQVGNQTIVTARAIRYTAPPPAKR